MVDEFEVLQGLVPDETFVLGIRLRPLCAGHIWILRRLKSPFLDSSSGAPSYAKLREAIIVLSHDFQGGLDALASPWLPVWLRLWHWRLTWCRLLSVDVAAAAEVVQAHIWKAYEFRPVLLPNSASEGPGDMESPRELVLVTLLISKLRMSFEEAVNCPWARAHWLHGCAAEMTGAANLGTPAGLERVKEEADAAHERLMELVRTGQLVRPKAGGVA